MSNEQILPAETVKHRNGFDHWITAKAFWGINLYNRYLVSSIRHPLVIAVSTYVIYSIYNSKINSSQKIITAILTRIIITIFIQFLLIGNTIFLFTAMRQKSYSKSTAGLFTKVILEIVLGFHLWVAGVWNQYVDESLFRGLAGRFYIYIFWLEMIWVRSFIIGNLSEKHVLLRYSTICGIKLENLLYVQFLYALTSILTQLIKVLQRLLCETSKELRESPLFMIIPIWAIVWAIAYGLIMPGLYFGIKNKCPKRIRRHLFGKIFVSILLVPKSVLESCFINVTQGKFEFFVYVCQFAFETFELLVLITYLEFLKISKQLDYTDNELEQSTKNFEINRSRLSIDYHCLLGEGFFGKVYKGTLTYRKNLRKSVISVAVKSMEYDSTQVNSLRSELKALALIMRGHKNVVIFYGINFVKDNGSTRANLVLEYCEKGSLDLFLGNIRKSIFQEGTNLENIIIEKQLSDWGFQIAQGMEFISSQQIIHGDLAARNILLDSNLTAKISDFGMSRKLYTYQKYATSLQTVISTFTYVAGIIENTPVSNTEVFPWRWMAPESLAELKFSLQSDVWSFGVLLWEIFNLGVQPWAGLMWTSDFVNMLKSGERLGKPLLATDDLYENIMQQCWSLDSNLRIPFSDIVVYFEHLPKINSDSDNNA